MSVEDISYGELRKLVEDGKTVVADFYTTWCPPCRVVEKILPVIAAKFPSVAFVRVNAEAMAPDELEGLGIYAVPTIIVYHDRREVKRFVGLSPDLPRMLEAELSALLTSSA